MPAASITPPAAKENPRSQCTPCLGCVTETAALWCRHLACTCSLEACTTTVDPVGVNASRTQTASAVFPEGQIGQSFYGWFMVGQFLSFLVLPL